MEKQDQDLLEQIFIDYIENCLNKVEDQKDIEAAEELYKKVCNLFEKSSV